MDTRYIKLSDGSNLKWLPKSHDIYLNKTTILYGMSGTGKSTLIREIMYLLRNHIVLPYVICQSAAIGDYDGIVPKICIKDKITKTKLEVIVREQRERAQLYKSVNDLDNLKNLFNKTNDQTGIIMEHQMTTIINEYIEKIYQTNITYSEKMSKKKKLEIDYNKNLKELYKSVIRRNENKLLLDRDILTDTDLTILTYMDFNPTMLIIFDDCAASFKKWVKSSDEIKQLFYYGRHDYVTLIISTQDEKDIDSELRKNTRISMFTTSQIVNTNFEKKSNGFGKNDVKRAFLCAQTIFQDENSEKPAHKKLVYMRDDPVDNFRYTIADEYDDFQIGSSCLWDYSSKIMPNNENGKIANKFLQYTM